MNYDTKAQHNTVASTGYSHFRSNFLFRKLLSYELLGQVQADKARGLQLRALAGGGLRYRLLRTHNPAIYAGIGLKHEHEEWKDPAQDNSLMLSDLLKSTNYLSLKTKLSKQISTDGIVYYQVGYDEGISRFRSRVSGDVTLQVKLTSRFSLRTNFSRTYEDEPIMPINIRVI